MSVPFKELGGSPVEQYGLEGFRAQRTFLIAWEDRDAFAADYLGGEKEHYDAIKHKSSLVIAGTNQNYLQMFSAVSAAAVQNRMTVVRRRGAQV